MPILHDTVQGGGGGGGGGGATGAALPSRAKEVCLLWIEYLKKSYLNNRAFAPLCKLVSESTGWSKKPTQWTL